MIFIPKYFLFVSRLSNSEQLPEIHIGYKIKHLRANRASEHKLFRNCSSLIKIKLKISQMVKNYHLHIIAVNPLTFCCSGAIVLWDVVIQHSQLGNIRNCADNLEIRADEKRRKGGRGTDMALTLRFPILGVETVLLPDPDPDPDPDPHKYGYTGWILNIY